MRYVIFIFTDEQNKDLLMVIEIWKIFIKVPRVVFTKTRFFPKFEFWMPVECIWQAP